MKIKLLCPNCYREETIKAFWSWSFHEDYFDWKKNLKDMEKSNWLKELPKIIEEIKVLECQANEIEQRLPQEELLKLKALHQKISFLHQRLNYNNELTEPLKAEKNKYEKNYNY